MVWTSCASLYMSYILSLLLHQEETYKILPYEDCPLNNRTFWITWQRSVLVTHGWQHCFRYNLPSNHILSDRFVWIVTVCNLLEQWWTFFYVNDSSSLICSRISLQLHVQLFGQNVMPRPCQDPNLFVETFPSNCCSLKSHNERWNSLHSNNNNTRTKKNVTNPKASCYSRDYD